MSCQPVLNFCAEEKGGQEAHPAFSTLKQSSLNHVVNYEFLVDRNSTFELGQEAEAKLN